MTDQIIKTCPHCRQDFTVDDILRNPEISPIGMCLDPNDLKFSLYFFNHENGRCGTTFTVAVEKLRRAVDEDIPPERKTGTRECEERCIDLDDHEPCSQHCYHAPYRRLLGRLLAARGLLPEGADLASDTGTGTPS